MYRYISITRVFSYYYFDRNIRIKLHYQQKLNQIPKRKNNNLFLYIIHQKSTSILGLHCWTLTFLFLQIFLNSLLLALRTVLIKPKDSSNSTSASDKCCLFFSPHLPHLCPSHSPYTSTFENKNMAKKSVLRTL